jgi:hypothetical protein
LQEGFVDIFISGGNSSLTMELSMALSERPAQFGPMQVTVLRELLQKESLADGGGLGSSSNLKMLSASLEMESFNHMLQAMEIDAKIMNTYLLKFRDWESTNYWQQLEWRGKKRAEVERAVQLFLDQHVHICSDHDVDKMMQQLAHFKAKLRQQPLLKLDEGSLVLRPSLHLAQSVLKLFWLGWFHAVAMEGTLGCQLVDECGETCAGGMCMALAPACLAAKLPLHVLAGRPSPLTERPVTVVYALASAI